MTAEEMYAQLVLALRDFEPPCNGHDVFMSPDATELQQAVCASICAGCPVADLCDAYATKSKVDLGFWGGKNRNPRRTNSSTTDPAAPGTNPQEEEAQS